MSSWSRGYIDPYADSTPVPEYVTVQEADRRAGKQALRAFFRAALIFGVLGFAAGKVWGLDISGSTVTVRPTDVPGAVAEVVFDNVNHNGSRDDGDYIAAGAGLVVGVTFTWETGLFGQDTVTITPPDGLICEPASCRIEVMEGFQGSVLLREYVGF